MFCSFVQTQVLVLVFCNVVLAIPRVLPSDGLANPAQRPLPIIHVQPALSVKPDRPQLSKDVSTLRRNATIKLFPPSPVTFRHAFAFGCKEPEFNTITLETDVCLSGSYYLNHNMLISEAPVCHDGSTPTLAYYPARGCVGVTQFESTVKPIPEHCLWGGASPLYWSMIFRCGPHATSAEGADKHEIAVPPTSPQSLSYTDIYKPYEGPHALLLSHSECSDRAAGWNGARKYTARVGTCLQMADSITIKRPALCPNGTRALWARFEKPNCNDGQISTKYGLIDIHDTDLDVEKCLLADAFGSGDQIRSMAFWCDGHIKVAPPQSKLMWGRYSEDGNLESRELVFKSLKPDTCVMMSGIRKVQSVNITRLGVCENGTTAALALYKNLFCGGNPAKLKSLDENDLNKWVDIDGAGSWALQCDGVKVDPARKASAYTPAPQSGEFKLCRGAGKTRTTFVRDPDTCLTSFTYPGDTHMAEITVTRAPFCANGTKATLALFKDGICQTEPDEFRTLNEHVLNQCLSLSGAKSWAFWCDGTRLGQGLQQSSNPTLEPMPKSTKWVEIKHPGGLSTMNKVEIPSQRPGMTAGTFSMNACTSDMPIFWSAEPDTCFFKHADRQIMLANPAICPDGTKASIALYKDHFCRATPVKVKTFQESDMARCLILEGIGSWGFLCEGIKAVDPLAKIPELPSSINLASPKKTDTTTPIPGKFNSLLVQGSFSEDPCIGMKRSYRHSPRDTCITRTSSVSRSITVSKPAMCANGTRAIMALYKDNSCRGQPEMFRDIDSSRHASCLAFTGMESWGFWCDGIAPAKQTEASDPAPINVIPISSRPKTVASKEADNSNLPLIPAPYRSPNSHASPGMWSATACVRNFPPSVLSSLPGTCNLITPNHPSQIHSSATCGDGSLAVVALYQRDYCGGPPDQFATLDFESKNKCLTIEGYKSWTFWCIGPKEAAFGSPNLKDIPSLVSVGMVVPEVQPGASLGLKVGVYVACVLMVMVGIWAWFGTAIANLMEVLFPWPISYPSVNADVLDEKTGEKPTDSEKEVVVDV